MYLGAGVDMLLQLKRIEHHPVLIIQADMQRKSRSQQQGQCCYDFLGTEAASMHDIYCLHLVYILCLFSVPQIHRTAGSPSKPA